VGEYGGEEDEVERVVGIREPEFLRADGAARVVFPVSDIGQLESEIGEARSYGTLAPGYSLRNYIESLVDRGGGEVFSEWNRHATDAAPDIEYVILRPQACQLSEVTDKFPADGQEVTSADEHETTRRNEVVTAAQQRVDNIKKSVSDGERELQRWMSGVLSKSGLQS
jgi:hypothetical protein